MSIIPWKQFSDMERFFGDDDWLMPVFSRTELGRPMMDMYETDVAVVVEVSVPGYDPAKVTVTLEDGILKISGAVEEKKEEEEKGYWKREIRQGSFERAVRVPIAVKEDGIDAVYEKGVLKIVMPKKEEKPAAKVKIHVKGK